MNAHPEHAAVKRFQYKGSALMLTTTALLALLAILLVTRDSVTAGILIGREHFRLKTPSVARDFMINPNEVLASERDVYGVIGIWNEAEFMIPARLLDNITSENHREKHNREALVARFLNALEQDDWIGLVP
jgi:hypothetical protein